MTQPTKSLHHFHSLAFAAVLALGGLAACGDDDPVAEAAAHMCACEKVNEPATDVAACEAELEAALAGASGEACVACINKNAGGSATDATCTAMASACTTACGF